MFRAERSSTRSSSGPTASTAASNSSSGTSRLSQEQRSNFSLYFFSAASPFRRTSAMMSATAPATSAPFTLRAKSSLSLTSPRFIIFIMSVRLPRPPRPCPP